MSGGGGAPRRDREGAKTESARMSVWHNGILIHDDVEVDGPTAAAVGAEVDSCHDIVKIA